jgi:hypothetical protein
MTKKKLRRPNQQHQSKQNDNLDNLTTIRPQAQQISSEISFIISAETTPKKMATPSRKTKQEMKVAFRKLRAPHSRPTTKITKTSLVKSNTCQPKN